MRFLIFLGHPVEYESVSQLRPSSRKSPPHTQGSTKPYFLSHRTVWQGSELNLSPEVRLLSRIAYALWCHSITASAYWVIMHTSQRSFDVLAMLSMLCSNSILCYIHFPGLVFFS